MREIMTNFSVPDSDKNYLEKVYDRYAEIDAESIKTDYTPEVADFYGRMELVINNANEYRDIENGFDAIELDAKKELQGTEIDMVLVMLKVGKKSAELWMPNNIGGNGIGHDFSQNFNITSNGTPRWATIMVHDMAGALEGVAGWVLGLLIAGGPVTLASYCVAVGFGAAVSSIKEALNG